MVEQRNGYVVRDRRGEPRAYDGYGLYKRYATQNGYRPRNFQFGDTSRFFTNWDWQWQISLARQIFARLPIVHGSVCQKNLYAVGCGWRYHYTGQNQDWGRAAEEYLNEIWYPNCDIRGEPYDFWLDLYLDGCAVDRDGDQLMVLRRPEDLGDYSGPLKLQWIAAHRIADGNAKADEKLGYKTVEGGIFSGARIRNGVIKDRDDATIGYRILNEDSTQTDVPVNSAQLLYEPDWNDLYRGVPRSAVACLDALDIEDINHFLKRQVKQDSSQGITHTNEKGAPMAGTALVGADELADAGSNPVADVAIEYLEGNEITYFKSGTGGKIEAIKGDRPSPNTEKFVSRIEMQALYSIGWSRHFMDPSMIGGASVRAIQDQGRKSVEWRQEKITLKRAKRSSMLALWDAIQRGVIPQNDSEPWYLKGAWSRPAQLSVDNGNDDRADQANLVNGTTTRTLIAGKKGKDWKSQVFPQTSQEVEAIIVDAKEKAERLGVPLAMVLNMMAQLPSNNALYQDTEAADPNEDPNGGKKENE